MNAAIFGSSGSLELTLSRQSGQGIIFENYIIPEITWCNKNVIIMGDSKSIRSFRSCLKCQFLPKITMICYFKHQDSFNGASRKHLESFKRASRELQESFKRASREL